MDTAFKSPTILSLCPGLLGLERGLIRAIGHINVAAYVEIEAFICQNIIGAMEAGVLAPAPIWTDVKTFPAKGFYKRIHGIIGGYPCQPFSNAGLKKGTTDPRHLWPYIQRHILAIKPVWCFFENVPGHLDLGYADVRRDLGAMGYAVEEGIYSAEECGAPHPRKRLFILAVANSYVNDKRAGIRELLRQAGAIKGKAQRKHRERLRNDTGDLSNRELADTMRTELQNALPAWGGLTQPTNGAHVPHAISPGTQYQVEGGFPGQQSVGIISGERGADRWPAPRGHKQYDWEEPRTIEPGMGCTINGYNYWEDLLRAYGNSVVEQTAEVAIIDLLLKHYKNAIRK